MSKPKKPKDFIKTPSYPGGSAAMKDFLSKQLKYPQEALEHKIEGSVSVLFKINGLGKVYDVKVKKGIGYGCDEEAIRIISMLSFEKANNRGLITTTNKTITINFKLPIQVRNTINTTSYSYTIVPAKPVQKVAPKSTKSYTISIKYP